MEGRKESEFGHKNKNTYLFVKLNEIWFKLILNVLAKMTKMQIVNVELEINHRIKFCMTVQLFFILSKNLAA